MSVDTSGQAAAEAADTDIAIVGDGRPVPRRAGRRHAVAPRPRRRGLPRRVLDARSSLARGVPGRRARRSRLRAPQRRARRPRDVRSRLLRDRTPRRVDHGSPAPPLHRVRLGGTRDGGSRARALRRRDRRLRRLRHEHLHAQQPADQPDAGRPGRHVPAPPHGQRQGLPDDDGVVQVRPARTVGQRADGLLARRSSPCTSPSRACCRSSATWRSPAARRSRCPTASATCTTRARSSPPTATAGRSTPARRAPS